LGLGRMLPFSPSSISAGPNAPLGAPQASYLVVKLDSLALVERGTTTWLGRLNCVRAPQRADNAERTKARPLPATGLFLFMALPREMPLRRGFFHVGLINPHRVVVLGCGGGFPAIIMCLLLEERKKPWHPPSGASSVSTKQYKAQCLRHGSGSSSSHSFRPWSISHQRGSTGFTKIKHDGYRS
jgi:hypothetical protein